MRNCCELLWLKTDGRGRTVLLAAAAALLMLLIATGRPAFAQTIDWTSIECDGGAWNDPPSGAAGPASQSFTDIGCSGVDMTVFYSGNMWDNNSTPNVYSTDAPVAPLATSLRWTNNRADTGGTPGTGTGPSTMTVVFSQPVFIDDFTVVSLSHFLPPSSERYEWIELRGYDEDGTLVASTGYTPSTWDTTGTLVTRPGSPLIQDDSSGIYFARGTSVQSTNCGSGIPLTSCGYDRFSVEYLATPITRIELVHFATVGSTIGSSRTSDRTSIAIEPFVITVPAALYDWGDAPDSGAGTGPGDYSTLAGSNGPSHVIVDGIFMGTRVDAEEDGQPTANSDGDDLNPISANDEDGVNITDLSLIEGQPALVRVNATNLTEQAALLCAWIDFNGNGTFEPGESANAPVPAGSDGVEFVLDFGIVPANGLGMVYSRFRLSTDSAGCAPTGPALNGEVEDHAVGIAAADQFDWGDAPDSGAAPGPGSYNTLMNNGGPSHGIVGNLYMGAGVDPEEDGQPTGSASGDDLQPVGAPDDEDGVEITDLVLIEGNNASVTVNVTNLTTGTAFLTGWIDFNANGLFEIGERAGVEVLGGADNLPFTLDFGTVPANGVTETFARFRFSTDDAGTEATGPAGDGEVEDYVVAISAAPAYDYGDAPDSYKTLDASGGPAHLLGLPLRMGAIVDTEENGLPSLGADGDDLTPAGAADDEDGVNVADLALIEATPAQVRVNVTNLVEDAAVLYGWIDFDGNGTFDADERAEAPVLAGVNAAEVVLNFGDVPSNGVAESYARFRLSTDGAAADPTGPARNGEVEDYPVTIAVIYDWGDAPDPETGAGIGNYNTVAADNGPNHKVVAGLYMGNRVDGEEDGQPTVNADGDDILPAGFPDDEDGVVAADLDLLTTGNAVVNVNVTNLLETNAVLYGWIDFNGNGIFEPGESAQTGVPAGSNNGPVVLDFGLVPGDGAFTTYARFRLSTDDAASSPIGPAGDGEVEDYIVTISDKPSAIDLAAFTATFVSNQVVIEWITSLELETLGYHLYRSTTDSRDDALPANSSLIPALGISGGQYRFIDEDVVAGKEYVYWLVEVTAKSGAHEYGPITIRTGPSEAETYAVFLPLVRTK